MGGGIDGIKVKKGENRIKVGVEGRREKWWEVKWEEMRKE